MVVNFKAYAEALGPKALALTKVCAEVANQSGASIVVAPAATDVARIAHEVRIPVFAQHVDAVEAGPRTGWVPPEAALEAGGAGGALDHSERKVPRRDLEGLIPRCSSLGLEVVVCADDPREAESLALLSPEFIAIEPPELIGGGGRGANAEAEGIAGGAGGGRRGVAG